VTAGPARRILGLTLDELAEAHGAAAQDSVIVIDPDVPGADSGVSGLPPEVLQELLTTWNDSATVRLPGGLTLPAGTSLTGVTAASSDGTRVLGTATDAQFRSITFVLTLPQSAYGL